MNEEQFWKGKPSRAVIYTLIIGGVAFIYLGLGMIIGILMKHT